MKIWYVLSVLLIALPLKAAIAPPSKPEVLGFSNWKNQKIRSAHTQYSRSQREYERSNGSVFEKNALYKTVVRNYRVLLATRKLSIHDYFQMYLMTAYPENKAAMKEALGSLNQEQVAELLTAYQKSLRGKTQRLYIQRPK